MEYHVFEAHKTDNVIVLLATNNANLALVRAGCASECQPLVVCMNTPFNCVLGNSWEDHIENIATTFTKAERQRESFKLPSPARQVIVNWIAEGTNYLKNYLDIKEHLFLVCK